MLHIVVNLAPPSPGKLSPAEPLSHWRPKGTIVLDLGGGRVL